VKGCEIAFVRLLIMCSIPSPLTTISMASGIGGDGGKKPDELNAENDG
jgi:hypothetical protein